ncbi:AraC family transcriptional regulator [Brevundimonas sp.]|uniref:helix-turn-helix domain-containing protein n=1 Tax=Brevundimonas sp. TaxID=1871086 RepID=UPI0025CEF92C|nr:AraC family transcriptional regulator [Brevundimonas sp.]
MTEATPHIAPELDLDLGEQLRAFIDGGGQGAWRAVARGGGAAVIRCTLRWPAEGRTGLVARLTLRSAGDLDGLGDDACEPGDLCLTLLAHGDFARVVEQRSGDYYLPEALTGLALAAAFPSISGPGLDLYRRAKCQEFACEILERAATLSLTPNASSAGLSMAEMERLIEARRVIMSRFDEKLTLDVISRACGLNRAKLTQGFRDVFGQTVAECLAEQRLLKAAADLRSTSRPVSTIGYGAGYLNNASFARAFAKRFGIPPTTYRRAGGAPLALAA